HEGAGIEGCLLVGPIERARSGRNVERTRRNIVGVVATGEVGMVHATEFVPAAFGVGEFDRPFDVGIGKRDFLLEYAVLVPVQPKTRGLSLDATARVLVAAGRWRAVARQFRTHEVVRTVAEPGDADARKDLDGVDGHGIAPYLQSLPQRNRSLMSSSPSI